MPADRGVRLTAARSRGATFALFSLLGCACGARQDFSGDYEGVVEAAASGADAAARRPPTTESWAISSRDRSWPSKRHYQIVITRSGSPPCALEGEWVGGYRLELSAGSSCARGGSAAVLSSGALQGHGALALALTWSLPSGELLREHGALQPLEKH